jgi:hypothetical protein
MMNAIPFCRAGSTALAAALSIALAANARAAADGNVVTITSCADAGAGSLRDALAAATDGAKFDVSAVDCADHTIHLTSGEIAVPSGDIVVSGIPLFRADRYGLTPTAIDAGGTSRIFAQAGGLLYLQGLTLRNGHSDRLGGCVYAAGDLTLFAVAVEHCTIDASEFGVALGGGAYVGGDLYMVGSVVADNAVHSDSTGQGGGIAVGGALTMSTSIVSGNVVDSPALGFGGGIYAQNDAAILYSTIVGNTATDIGGIDLFGADGIATLRIEDTTISGNVGGHVGGVFALQSPITVASSTIAFNVATGDGGFGGLAVSNSPTLLSTILANNTGLDLAQQCVIPPCGLTSAGDSNLVMTTNMPVPADTLTDDPELQPLGDNGGPTPTHALPATSPAIDRGSGVDADGVLLDYDQRGQERDVGDAPDIGAFERAPFEDVIFESGFDNES